jgi:hypothetical protein
MFLDKIVFVLTAEYRVLTGKATNTNFVVFSLTRPLCSAHSGGARLPSRHEFCFIYTRMKFKSEMTINQLLLKTTPNQGNIGIYG